MKEANTFNTTTLTDDDVRAIMVSKDKLESIIEAGATMDDLVRMFSKIGMTAYWGMLGGVPREEKPSAWSGSDVMKLLVYPCDAEIGIMNDGRFSLLIEGTRYKSHDLGSLERILAEWHLDAWPENGKPNYYSIFQSTRYEGTAITIRELAGSDLETAEISSGLVGGADPSVENNPIWLVDKGNLDRLQSEIEAINTLAAMNKG